MTLLTAEYGEMTLKPCNDHLGQLVMTILSHRTTREDEQRAFRAMWDAYGSWDAIAEADTAALTRLLDPVRFPQRKAPYIQETLRRIYAEHGAYSVDFLAEMETGKAMRWLLALPGVGLKTASLLMLFCFHRPVLPVDTHVHRVSKRLGILPVRASAEKAHTLLLQTLPKDAASLYRYHRLLRKHGQKVCVFERPRCAACLLKGICPTAPAYL